MTEDQIEQIETQFQQMAIRIAAIAMVLINKGIITEAELQTATLKCTALGDQIWAKREEDDKPPCDGE